MAAPRSVLLVCAEEAHIGELARVAGLLQRSGRFAPVVFIEQRIAASPLARSFPAGVHVVLGGAPSPGRARGTGRIGGLVDRATRLPASALPRRLAARLGAEAYFILRDHLLRREAQIAAVLAEQRADLLVLAEDNVELDSAVWIAAARRRGLRSVIVPYTIAGRAEFAESYVGHLPYRVESSAANRLAARLFPRWTLSHKGHRLLRTTPGRIYAYEELGLTPPDPWLLNSGHFDALAAESPAMVDYYAAAGIPARQIRLTGSLANDRLGEALREAPARRAALLDELALPRERPLLVCALPPDQNTYDRPGCEHRSFADIVLHWGDVLRKVDGWNVVVRPHPKTRAELLSPLRDLGLAVTFADTASLVPLCDLYIACVSATIRWATACGKPVVNYDLYRYEYGDYDTLPGVVSIATRAEFAASVERLTGDGASLARLAALQQAEAPRWGPLDGTAGAKLLALFDELAAPCAATAEAARGAHLPLDRIEAHS